MNLTLSRPLVFFDLETTGLNVGSDRIVEIGLLKLHPDGTSKTKTKRLNPEIPISAEASSIHGIFNKDVAGEPTFKDFAPELNSFLKDCDLAGYNSNKFDLPVLVDEFLRVEIDFDIKGRKLVDVQNIFHKMEQRTLAAAYKFYCDKNLTDAHQAEADTLATYDVLIAQLDKYKNLKGEVTFLHEFCNSSKNVDLAGRIIYDDKKQEIFNFGKHKGKTVSEVFEKDPSYYDWMMRGDFSRQTKQVLTGLKLKGFNKQ
jgi:DNA polymerase-3 subunit epsilon